MRGTAEQMRAWRGPAVLTFGFYDRLGGIRAQQLWMAGAGRVMTAAMMTRATLGNTGQTPTAGSGTVMIYLAVIGAGL